MHLGATTLTEKYFRSGFISSIRGVLSPNDSVYRPFSFWAGINRNKHKLFAGRAFVCLKSMCKLYFCINNT